MDLVVSVADMASRAGSLKIEGKSMGFVPTMGYLHEGHLSLMRRARAECGVLVVSIFVNPTQFAPGEDYKTYPRDTARDRALAEKEGVDILFCPTATDIYPEGDVTHVEVDRLTAGLCGKSRPGHFRGVTTVVTKLFHIVQPDIAYFGQKDAQQAAAIKRMVHDLHMPLQIVVCPIVREPDGLAMSSRNMYLSPEERRSATVLYRALGKAKALYGAGERRADVLVASTKNLIAQKKGVKLEYVEAVDPETMEPVKTADRPTLVALAARVGKARLIDNVVLGAEKE